MPLIVRTATDSDADKLASSRLSHEAFGYPAETDPGKIPASDPAAWTPYLAELDGAAVGKCRDRHYESWWGGRTVATAGIASVTTRAEERGEGVMRELMGAVMRGARDRGAPISTLVPTAPGAYRGFGYESVTTYDFLRVSTHLLAHVKPGAGSVRRATVDDWPLVLEVYAAWASAQNGPLTRTGANFASRPEDVLREYAFTLAFDPDGECVGYASWKHVGGYYSDGKLETGDVLATTLDGYRLLLASLGTHYAVAPMTELMSSGSSGLDVLRLVLPDRPWQTYETDHYMLAVLDVVAAFEARGYPSALDVTVGFSVDGAFLDGVDGAYELTVRDGRGTCERVGDVDWRGPVFTAGGLALLYAGAQSCANIAMVGGLSGEAGEDEVLDTVFGGRQVHIRDSF